MKQLTAIVFLCVFLFNLAGYRLLTQYWQSHENKQLEAKLDKQQYNEKDLISIKTPLTLPYYTNTSTFERVNGELKIDGVVYKYVKRRIFHDTLEVLCIPNGAKMQLDNVRDDFFKLTADIQTSHSEKKQSASNTIKIPSFNYCNKITTFSTNLYLLKELSYRPFYIPIYSFTGSLAIEQPPDAA